MIFALYLVSAALLYLAFLWMMKRFVKPDGLRKILVWTGTILFPLLVYVGFYGMALFSILYEPSRDFNKVDWFKNKSTRYEMVNNLIESEILVKKSREEVIELIGTPSDDATSSNSGKEWTYDLGMSKAGLGFQFNYLRLTFDNEKTIKVEKLQIMD